MYNGPLREHFSDRTSPVTRFTDRLDELAGKLEKDDTYAVRMFALGGKEHSKKYGTKLEHFAKIAEKNHRHSSNNKNALYQHKFTTKQIMEA